VSVFFTSFTNLIQLFDRTPSLVSAIVNMFISLLKCRPNLADVVVTALSKWAPTNLSGLLPSEVKSTEKSIRVAIAHLLRNNITPAHKDALADALRRQEARMENAALEASRTRDEEATRKRKMIADEISLASKKRRVEAVTDKTQQLSVVDVFTNSNEPNAAAQAQFDITTLPVQLVAELIIGNFQVITEERLQEAIRVGSIFPSHFQKQNRLMLFLARSRCFALQQGRGSTRE
jgi:symplekin